MVYSSCSPIKRAENSTAHQIRQQHDHQPCMGCNRSMQAHFSHWHQTACQKKFNVKYGDSGSGSFKLDPSVNFYTTFSVRVGDQNRLAGPGGQSRPGTGTTRNTETCSDLSRQLSPVSHSEPTPLLKIDSNQGL